MMEQLEPSSALDVATGLLIREHYKAQGCFDWTRDKFLRLCISFDETPRELAERVGMSLHRFKQLMASPLFSFLPSEGILLAQHERWMDYVRTGNNPSVGLFFEKGGK
jgi:hypothetical protein